jgi:tetratricopeptide (TPR) repeat protein
MALGNYPEAIADFLAVREDETTPQLRWWRAQAYLLNKEYEKAERECALGLSKPPQDAQLWSDLWLSRGWACYGQNHLEGALSDFLEALRQKPSALAHLGRGLAYRALGLEQAAADDLAVFVGYHAGSEGIALYQLSRAFDAETAVQLAAARTSEGSLPHIAIEMPAGTMVDARVPA